MAKNPYFCWIGPYNAHCFRNDKGEYVKEDKTCVFCSDPDPALTDPETPQGSPPH